MERLSRRKALVLAGESAIAALAACSPVTITPMSTEIPKPGPDKEGVAIRDLADQAESFRRYHHPKVEGKEVPAAAFVTLSFREEDLVKAANGNPKLYEITEGWIYSQAEQAIHQERFHRGIDWAVPYGTPVVAPVDGWAMSSYQHVWNRDLNSTAKEKPIIPYQGKHVGLGLGVFGMIYVPDYDRFIFLAHLSRTVLPFTKPVRISKDEFNPARHNLNAVQRKPDALTNNPAYKFVKRGELVGYVGTSGLMWGEGFEEYKEGDTKITEGAPTWDEPHVHFE